MTWSVPLAAVAAALGWLMLGGCTTSATSPGSGTGGLQAGSTGGSPGSGGADAPGSGGSGRAGSGGSLGSGGTSTGGGSSGGVGGPTDAAVDAASSGSGGRASTGGGAGGAGGGRSESGGAGGTPSDGSADLSADAVTDQVGSPDGEAGTSPAAPLDKFRFDCPCKPAAADHLSNNNCNVTPETDRQTIVKTMGGDPGTIYDVTFHVRGLTEPNTYKNGTLQVQRFYVGGTTSTAGYTSYMMTVADPAQHYFFNYNATTDHIHFKLDYQVTVKIRGGTKVTFDVNGDGSMPDGHSVANFDQTVVPDVPPAPMWYDGQFVQLDVVSADMSR